MVRDEIPILGPAPGYENLTLACGFSGHGFALSPMTGQVIAELILDGVPSIPLDDFALSRFAPHPATAWTATPHAG